MDFERASQLLADALVSLKRDLPRVRSYEEMGYTDNPRDVVVFGIPGVPKTGDDAFFYSVSHIVARGEGSSPEEAIENWKKDLLSRLPERADWFFWRMSPEIMGAKDFATRLTTWVVYSRYVVPASDRMG